MFRELTKMKISLMFLEVLLPLKDRAEIILNADKERANIAEILDNGVNKGVIEIKNVGSQIQISLLSLPDLNIVGESEALLGALIDLVNNIESFMKEPQRNLLIDQALEELEKDGIEITIFE